MASAGWIFRTLAGPLVLDAWIGDRDRWKEGRTMVVWRSTGKKVGAMSLEGEASKAWEIACQAIIALRGARFEDTFFPTIVSAVARFPLEGHRIKAGTMGGRKKDQQR